MNNVLLKKENSAPSKLVETSDSTKRHRRKKRKRDSLKRICWCMIPMAFLLLLYADATGVYVFTTERLLVLGAGMLIILLPCFSEISIKDLTVRRNK